MNKYKTLEVIGEGAYGIVLKCKNKQTGEVFAIKQFKDSDASNESINSANMRELKLLRSLQHDNIVKIEDAFNKKGKLCIVFEYMNKSLLQIIEEFKNGLPLEKIKSYSHQTCKAIQYCHSKDIIHRDVKPENLLINEKGILKLCDFGFARNLIRANDKLTEYVATRWYRAPELLLGDSYGKPVDIWSIGCIIGEMGDGEALFPGNSEIDQLYLIQKTLGPLPPSMVKHLLKSQRFAGWSCPISEASTTLERHYKGILDYPLILLMKETLCLEPSQRLTADGCLNHAALKADLQSLNCNGNNPNRARGTKVKLIPKKCSLPPVKFFLKSNKSRPRNLTCRVENGVLIKRMNNSLVEHDAEHSTQNSSPVQGPAKQTDLKVVLPVLAKEDINVDNTNSNNDPANCAKFSKKSKLNENKVTCAGKKIKSLQHGLRELKRKPLVNIEVRMDENPRLNRSHRCPSVSLEIRSVEKLTNRKKFKKLNEVGRSCIEEAAQDGENPSRLSVGKDELVAPCLTPSSQTKENLETINTRLPGINVLQRESLQGPKLHCRVCKPFTKDSRLAFRLKAIKGTNFSVTPHHSISSMIPISTNVNVIKSSSCIFELHVDEKGKPSGTSTKPSLTQCKAKMLSSANYGNVKARTAVKQNFAKKYGTSFQDRADPPALSCKSRIPIAIRCRKKASQNS